MVHRLYLGTLTVLALSACGPKLSAEQTVQLAAESGKSRVPMPLGKELTLIDVRGAGRAVS